MNTSSTVTRIGRLSEAERIQNAINEWIAAPAKTGKFSILGISGYGGVGKSYLLNSVLAEQRLETRDAITVRLDGSNKQLLVDFMAMVDEKLAPRDIRFKGSHPSDEQFPETRALVTAQRKLESKVQAEVDVKGGSDGLKRAAKALYKFTPLIRQIPQAGPVLAPLLDASEKMKLEEYAEPAAELLKGLKALNPSKPWPFKKLRLSPHERLAVDPMSAIAEAYETDIRARIVGYEGKNIFKLLNRRAKGINRFLLVLDDYESVSGVLGQFCIAYLFPKLIEAPYPVLVLIAGRHDLRNAHVEFSKSLSPYIKDRISLQSFTREESVLFLKRSGYEDPEATKLYEESSGFPYVLSLLADFKSNQGEWPATFYQQFHERTTHWMTEQQKEWLLALCYLDEVNEGTISKMLPDVSASHVINWFRRDASVLDGDASRFRVNPYIRRMTLQHHVNLVGADIQRDYEERGKAAARTRVAT